MRDTRVASGPPLLGVPSVLRVDPAGRPHGKGLALGWNEDPTGDGAQPVPDRRISWQAPRELRGPRIPQDPRAARPADRPSRPAPEQDPRQAAPRPRPAGTASTGQLPAARTRQTPGGPTGTARIPIVRQTPAGPAAPRPGVRQPEGPGHGGQPPVRSRLRTPPPVAAPPRTLPGAPAVPQPSPVLPAPPAPSAAVPQPLVMRPFSQLTPIAVPAPPSAPAVAAPPAPRRSGRHLGRGLLALVAVMALSVLWGLPAFASEALDAPPVLGVSTTGGLQRLQVGQVNGGGATTDAVSGSLPVAPAPIWIKPVIGHLGDPFGPRPIQPVPGVNLFHRGQDIVAPCGEPIHAAHDGVVQTASYWGTYGNWILLDNGGGIATGYAHASQILVSVGQHVKTGQVIGLVGQTGAATGCHLHLEVHINGVAVNPVPFFAAKHISLG